MFDLKFEGTNNYTPLQKKLECIQWHPAYSTDTSAPWKHATWKITQGKPIHISNSYVFRISSPFFPDTCRVPNGNMDYYSVKTNPVFEL